MSDDFRELVAMRLEINSMGFYKYITHNRITYTINDFIVIKRKSESNLPQYALIKSIVYDVIKKVKLLIPLNIHKIKNESLNDVNILNRP